MKPTTDTIVAIATPPGRGGIGIVRTSGPAAAAIAGTILQRDLVPRHATYSPFRAGDGSTIDVGIALYYAAPHSYTGEDTVEYHAHGSVAALDILVKAILSCGARLARPGEFSERAFLNGKMDLAQAEAIADLIDSNTEQAARAAVRSLTGEFSERVCELMDGLTNLRVVVEVDIDFPDEDLDVNMNETIIDRLRCIHAQVVQVLSRATQGQLLREGMKVVLAGAPNAGKSSLLNTLVGHERAIVSTVPGTTRDVIEQALHIDGMPVHISDTAGLRHTIDEVEVEGVRRAHATIADADRVLLVVDDTTETPQTLLALRRQLPADARLTVVYNKVDISHRRPGVISEADNEMALSAKTGAGIDALCAHLKRCAGFRGDADGVYSARRRHVHAIERALAHIETAITWSSGEAAAELVAEELRVAHRALGEITGEITSDDLLGQIFATFCIGK